jgi:signal peptidase II
MTDERQPTRRPYPFIIALAVVVIVADQASKWWAEATLASNETIPVIGDLIGFRLVYNPGAAFSIGENFTWIFAIVAAVAAVAIAWFAWRVRSRAWAVVFGLVLGGAITHLGDRLFREPGFARGHVVDFIVYGNWFVGNIADIAIVGGAALGVLFSLLRIDMKRDAPAAAPVDADSPGTGSSTTP